MQLAHLYVIDIRKVFFNGQAFDPYCQPYSFLLQERPKDLFSSVCLSVSQRVPTALLNPSPKV